MSEFIAWIVTLFIAFECGVMLSEHVDSNRFCKYLNPADRGAELICRDEKPWEKK